MSNLINKDRLRYRTMSWRYICMNLAAIVIVGTLLNILATGTTALVVIPLFIASFSWQMGVLSERNEWHTNPEKGNRIV